MKSFSQDLQKEIFAIPKGTKSDPVLRWNQTDEHFFANGACQVLAFLFKDLHPDYSIYLIKPFHPRGWHVFASNGLTCFDYQGYTKFDSYLQNYTAVCKSVFENWDCEVIKIEEDFNTYCEKYNHRKLEEFLHNPLERARKYIEKYEY